MTAAAILVAMAAAAAGLTPLAPVAATPQAPRHDVSLAIPMTCNGQPEVIHVSAHLPQKVKAGRAFTISNAVTDVQFGGTVHLSTAGAVPDTISAGADRPSTTQLVADGHPGDTIEVKVTGASYIKDGFAIPGTLFTCTPATEVSLGTIRLTGPARRPAPSSTPVDVTHAVEFHLFGGPTLISGEVVRTTFSVPNQLVSGQTFTLPDLQVIPIPDLDGAVVLDATIVPAGTDQTRLTTTSVQTVTAQPGETVDIYLQSARVILSGSFLGTEFPLGSGHLASIPVVAG